MPRGSNRWGDLRAEGIEGLEKLPGVGRTISRALQQLIRGGRWPLLERLQGSDFVEQLFASVPSIGRKLARRIHLELGVETLAELQAASWDGRLESMSGIGEKRVRAVRESLVGRGRVPSRLGLNQSGTGRLSDSQFDLTAEISIAELLDVDDEYRFRAAKGTLPCVAPRRCNPTGETWLPILHTQRHDRYYTAMYSNTEHAHAMGTTRDWVVIYLEDHQRRGQHGRWTVITSRFGKLRGQRIVSGREHECAEYYTVRTV